ncbi:carboxypeptidase-like regulatory domain-containing protein [Polaribacter glomeratus]|uniref:Carboxypeptidase-like regulatory domain-containing protein n=1 Tax=Polaribacter glomeratus TaxID=102 RepID=A0A2S7WJQ8_9FLAO|nr:carboxypeptidase-like regulatory domain-containing protein [Polaribacter glomeratus]PQJ77541.1 hypothetical protein BTO16_17145 [Polaribacter glomeratus]TXD66134.1 carboxypeptidase-like regulatory domain-containing protein [Polaribacter glomeratus]
MKKILVYILLISSWSVTLFAQQIDGKIRFKIIDQISAKPVVYATVMLKNLNRGTHADFNGYFEIPAYYLQTGIIKISSIGYYSKEFKLADVKKDGVHILYLTPSTDLLNEVIVKSSKKRKKRRLLAKEIVRKAIKNILENYPTEAYSYIGYYRDYQQPVDSVYQKLIKSNEPVEYLNVHEAIIESFDNGFDSDKLKEEKNQSLLYNYRVNKNFIEDSTLTVPYDNKSKKFSESVYISPLGGNELNILNLTNAIRNYDKMSFSFVNNLNKNFINNHNFKVEEVVFLDKTPLYKISFTSKKERTSYDYAAYGTIYIAKGNFAIYKLNYNLYYIKNKNPQFAITIEYSKKKDKMYLNYITFNNFFEAKNGNYFKIDKTLFNLKNNSFNIYFNRQIALNSLEPFRRNFKIYYKGVKLKVISVSPFEGSDSILTVKIDEESLKEINFENEKENPNYGAFFSFDISNITDQNSFEIDKRASVKMNQYREFFVQEVFENKKAPVQKNFINKNLPLSQSKITPLKLENNYWLNSPLKKVKD